MGTPAAVRGKARIIDRIGGAAGEGLAKMRLLARRAVQSAAWHCDIGSSEHSPDVPLAAFRFTVETSDLRSRLNCERGINGFGFQVSICTDGRIKRRAPVYTPTALTVSCVLPRVNGFCSRFWVIAPAIAPSRCLRTVVGAVCGMLM